MGADDSKIEVGIRLRLTRDARTEGPDFCIRHMSSEDGPYELQPLGLKIDHGFSPFPFSRIFKNILACGKKRTAVSMTSAATSPS